MEYSLRFDSNIHALWNETIAVFLGYLKSNNFPIVTSETVKDETNGEITVAVNRVVDRAHIQRSGQVRGLMLLKSKNRFRQFCSFADVKPLKGDKRSIENFYNNLLAKKETRTKLEKVRQLKGRQRLLPEDSDMTILSEAISLKNKDTLVVFISKDEDFCQFSQEIQNQFGIIILQVQNLLSFKDELEKKKKAVN